jgi:carbonic anhydrase
MCDKVSANSPVSRRALLKMAGVAGVSTLVSAGGASTLHGDALAQMPQDPSPEQALRALMDGNARFMAGKTTSPNRTLKRLQELGEKQAPFASILSCADSRVPLEILFDTGFGDMFVCRAAGNIATPQIIGSLEYGTLVLGSRVLMVLGHTGCGAVAATLKGDPVPGQIGSLYPYIYPAIIQAGSKDLKTVVAPERAPSDGAASARLPRHSGSDTREQGPRGWRSVRLSRWQRRVDGVVVLIADARPLAGRAIHAAAWTRSGGGAVALTSAGFFGTPETGLLCRLRSAGSER